MTKPTVATITAGALLTLSALGLVVRPSPATERAAPTAAVASASAARLGEQLRQELEFRISLLGCVKIFL